MESSAELTAFGRLLVEKMAERGVSGPDELAERATEAGYPFDPEVMRGHMYDHWYERQDLNIVYGPAEVLNLDAEAEGRLAIAYIFDR